MDNNIFEIEGFEVSVIETGNQILASYTRGNSKALLACDRELENVKATFFNKDNEPDMTYLAQNIDKAKFTIKHWIGEV